MSGLQTPGSTACRVIHGSSGNEFSTPGPFRSRRACDVHSRGKHQRRWSRTSPSGGMTAGVGPALRRTVFGAASQDGDGPARPTGTGLILRRERLQDCAGDDREYYIPRYVPTAHRMPFSTGLRANAEDPGGGREITGGASPNRAGAARRMASVSIVKLAELACRSRFIDPGAAGLQCPARTISTRADKAQDLIRKCDLDVRLECRSVALVKTSTSDNGDVAWSRQFREIQDKATPSWSR